MAKLQAELDRLRNADPFRALQLGYDADAQQIRARFLSVTKQYHPSRYARMDRDVLRVANEVFLQLKAAYAQLSDEAKRERLRQTCAPAAPAAPAPDSETPRPATKPAAARKRPQSTRRSGSGARTSGAAPKLARPTTRVPRSPTTERGPGGTRRRPGTTDASEVASALQDTVRRRNETYELGLKLLAGGRYAEARALFHKVAAEDPKTKKFRLQLHYCWGLEHEDAGRIEDARAEFQRAIQVDPEFKRAHEALDRLPGSKRGGGFFSKFFGR